MVLTCEKPRQSKMIMRKDQIMNRLLLAVILLLSIIQPALADEKSHRKLAEELLTLMDAQKNSEQMLHNLRQMQMTQLQKMNIPPEASDIVKSMQTQLMDLMAKEMSWDSMKEDYISVYVDTFTEGELRGIMGFYKSPAGKAFLKKTPEMMKRTLDVSQKRMEKIMPKIQEMTKKMMEELKARRADKPKEP